MTPRMQLIAVLVVIEIAIVGGIVVSIRGDSFTPWSAPSGAAAAASGQNLAEGGRHQVFDAGLHPALTVDIGYADLTIVTGNPSQIDVGVSRSDDLSFLHAKSAITARKDGETVRIATTTSSGWSMGDNRMVTVVVPPNTQVNVVSAGDIKANGLRADATFNSTGAGSVAIVDFNAPALHITASDGRITMQQVVVAHLEASSDDGRIEGSALQVRDGNVESSDGRVTLGFAAGSDTLVTAQTSDGKIHISGFPDAAVTSRRANDDSDSSSSSVRVGAGTGRLNVHASDGNINLSLEG